MGCAPVRSYPVEVMGLGVAVKKNEGIPNGSERYSGSQSRQLGTIREHEKAHE